MSEHTIVHDGYMREYILYKPREIIQKAPLLFVLHGGGGTNSGMIDFTFARFNQLADLHKFYVVYPQGLEKGWNDGRNDLKQFASQNNIDDVGFFHALIQKLKKENPVDGNRIFFTGISNGGFMSFRLGCELRDQIRAIAPVTASIAEDALRYCGGKSNVSLVLFNGTEDLLVPYHGGYVKLFGKKRGKITSTRKTIDIWLDMLDCHHIPTKQQLADKKDDDTSSVTIFDYTSCRGGNRVTLYRINGGGHTWPGGKPFLPRIVGNTSKAISASDEIWEFFKSFK